MIVVMCNGCFDPLHIGHLFHLRAAKAMGDKLIVALTNDESVRKEKGPQRPVFLETLRAAMLRELRCVDEVIVVSGWKEAVDLVRPHIYVKGKEYIGRLEKERSYVESCGGRIVFTTTPAYSSSALLSGAYLGAAGARAR